MCCLPILESYVVRKSCVLLSNHVLNVWCCALTAELQLPRQTQHILFASILLYEHLLWGEQSQHLTKSHLKG